MSETENDEPSVEGTEEETTSGSPSGLATSGGLQEDRNLDPTVGETAVDGVRTEDAAADEEAAAEAEVTDEGEHIEG
jgi:hypothetical protein